MHRRSTDLYGGGHSLCNTVSVDTCCYICPYSQNDQVNYEFWVLIMCPYIVINYDKFTTLVGILIVEEAVHGHVRGVMW